MMNGPARLLPLIATLSIPALGRVDVSQSENTLQSPMEGFLTEIPASIPQKVPADGNTALVILSNPRSGTSWIVDLLANHEESSFVYPECFRGENRSMIHECFDEMNLKISKETIYGASTEELLTLLLQKRNVWWKADSHVYGFKFMIDQLDEVEREDASKFFNEHGVKLLNIVRENELKRCFSVYVLKQTGQAHVEHDVESKKVTVKPDFWGVCHDYTKRINQWQQSFLANIKPSQKLVVHYEDMVANTKDTFAAIQNFAGMKTEFGTSDMKKMHVGDLADQIENWDETLPIIEQVFGKKNVAKWRVAL